MVILVLTTMLVTACRRHEEKDREVPFRNLAEEYEVEDGSLYVRFPLGNSLPYVDVESFIMLLEGALETERIGFDYIDDALTIEYTTVEDDDAEIEEDIELRMEIDFAYDTVTVNRYDFFRVFAAETKTDFGKGLEIVRAEETPPEEQTFDLAHYGFSLEKTENGHLMPFHLANLFFSGSMYDVYFNGETLYGVDTYQLLDDASLREMLNDTAYNHHSLPDDIKAATRDFLIFALDHFYGLKGIHEVDSFRDLVLTREEDLLSSESSHYEALNRIAYDLDDLHTSFLMSGIYLDDYEVSHDYSYLGSRSRTFVNARHNVLRTHCAQEEGVIHAEEGFAIILLKRFTEDTPEAFRGYLEEVEEQDDIDRVVIDITCNTGGVMGTMYRTFAYMCDDELPQHRINAKDGSATSAWMTSENEAFAFDFYLLSSPATYSAANKMLSIAKETGAATIIGQDSLGGAASITSLIVPSGAVLVMSSASLLADFEHASLERGVSVDVEIPLDSLTDIDAIRRAIGS